MSFKPVDSFETNCHIEQIQWKKEMNVVENNA